MFGGLNIVLLNFTIFVETADADLTYHVFDYAIARVNEQRYVLE